MFNFKSKKVKKLERMCDMLEMDLRELEERYTALKMRAVVDKSTCDKIDTLRCCVQVDTFFGEEDAIKYGIEEMKHKLAKRLGDYVDIRVTGDDTAYRGRRQIEGTIRVLRKENIC